MAFRDLTIRKKLTVLMMGVSAAAVLLACIIFSVMIASHLKQTYRDDLSSLTEALARNCEAPLAFRMPEDAERILSALTARPSVKYACIRTADGSVFAEYGRRPDRDGTGDRSGEALHGYLSVGREIVVGERTIGSLTLYDDMRGMDNTRAIAVAIMVTAVFLSLMAAALLIAPLQKQISGPIIALSSSVERITREHDFSLRAEKAGSDEVGTLVDAFNTMIGRIEIGNRELLKSENRFRTLVDQAVDAFFLFNPDGTIIDVNRRACDCLGYSREELLSLSLMDIESAGGSGGAPAPFCAALEQREAVTHESLLRRKDGFLFPVEVRYGLLEIGGSKRIMGIARDISERREAEAERAKLEAQLRHAQKMEAVGVLAGGVAHDFNNILTAIIGYASLLQKSAGRDGEQRNHVDQILESANRAAGLTKSLLAFSRKQVVELKPLDVNELIGRIQKMLSRLIGEDITFTVTCAPGPLMVEADQGQIEQVLMNLATNARDAMPQGGALQITTGMLVLTGADRAPLSLPVPGAYAHISVADSGAGIDKEILEHIFEPFYTTKEVGKGTGLGLSIVYGIIRKHNGFINVESAPGRGTTFDIYLPLKPASGPGPRAEEAVPAMQGTGTLLLVEDDPAVRRMLKVVLEESGYAVVEAGNGAEAVEVFKRNRGVIRLVLSDLIMPKMNGWEAYSEIRKIQPGIGMIFMSGYAADVIARKGILDQGLTILQKPVNPGELLGKIRAALES